jgi:hemerythrin-like metal-binding protein
MADATSEPYPATGVAEIDAEHRRLGEMSLALRAASRDGDVAGAMRLAADLQATTAAHFAEEEQLMTAIGYAGESTHRQAHREYSAALAQHVLELARDGFSPAVLHWIEHIDGWFHFHVVSDDIWLGVALVDARLKTPRG